MNEYYQAMLEWGTFVVPSESIKRKEVKDERTDESK